MTNPNVIKASGQSSDAARRIAMFFGAVCGVGLLPAVVAGLYFLGYGFVVLSGLFSEALEYVGIDSNILEVALAAAGFVSGVAFILLGFVQMRFYLRRAKGVVPNARRWWTSTYLYNLVGLGMVLAITLCEPHIGGVVAAMWFGLLSALAVVARSDEKSPGDGSTVGLGSRSTCGHHRAVQK